MLEGRWSLREYRPSSDRSPQESFCTLRVTGAGSGGGLNVLYTQNLSAVWRRVGYLLQGWYSVLKLEGFSPGVGRHWSPAEPVIDIAELEWRDTLGVYLVVR